jgi:hypothetical protein
MNDELPVDFEFTRIAHFQAEPKIGKLLPLQSRAINIRFHPNNFGVFNSNMTLSMIKGAYKVPIKMLGKSVQHQAKQIPTRGPGSTTANFTKDRKFIVNEPTRVPTSNKTKILNESRTLQSSYRTDYSAKAE